MPLERGTWAWRVNLGQWGVSGKLEGGKKFKIKSDFMPAGDQPEAIKKLVQSANKGEFNQVLLGVTGSGKTFTMAKVIEETNRPGTRATQPLNYRYMQQ